MCRIFPSIDEAREAAPRSVQTMIATKRHPNKVKRQLDLAKLSLSEAFAHYRSHLLGRTKPAKPNTLNVLIKLKIV